MDRAGMRTLARRTFVLGVLGLIAMACASVALAGGGSTFGKPHFHPTGLNDVGPVGVGDLNGDGRKDIVTAGHSDQEISVLSGSKHGFKTFHTYDSSYVPSWLAIGDINRDGRPNIVYASSQLPPGHAREARWRVRACDLGGVGPRRLLRRPCGPQPRPQARSRHLERRSGRQPVGLHRQRQRKVRHGDGRLAAGRRRAVHPGARGPERRRRPGPRRSGERNGVPVCGVDSRRRRGHGAFAQGKSRIIGAQHLSGWRRATSTRTSTWTWPPTSAARSTSSMARRRTSPTQ